MNYKNKQQALIKATQQELVTKVTETQIIKPWFGDDYLQTTEYIQIPNNLTLTEYDGTFNGQALYKSVNQVDANTEVGRILTALNQKQNQIMKQVARNVEELNTELDNCKEQMHNGITNVKKLQAKLINRDQQIDNFAQEFTTLNQELLLREQQTQEQITLLGNAGNGQNNTLARLALAQTHINELGNRVIALERHNQYLTTQVENKKDNFNLLLIDYQNLQRDKDNDNQLLNLKINNLQNDKNEMFGEYQGLKTKLQELTAKNLLLEQQQTILQRNQKIGLFAKAIKWTTFWVMPTEKHILLQAALDTGETYNTLRNLDAWTYEIVFFGIGIFAAYLLQLFRTHKNKKD